MSDAPRRNSEVVAPPPGAELLTPGQAAYRLRVSATTVRRLMAAGTLEVHRGERRALVPAASLERFIREADRPRPAR